MWFHTRRVDNIFIRLDAMVLRHFNALDTSMLKDGPDGEAESSMSGNMRRAVDEFPWAVFLNDVSRRNANLGHARQVRVMVDATNEYGSCLRHPCVGFDWAPDPDAPVPTALATFTHIGVWRPSRWTSHRDAGAAGGELGGRHRPCFRQPARSRSRSPPRGVYSIWPTRASSPAAVSLLRTARVREVRLPAPRMAALAAVANA